MPGAFVVQRLHATALRTRLGGTDGILRFRHFRERQLKYFQRGVEAGSIFFPNSAVTPLQTVTALFSLLGCNIRPPSSLSIGSFAEPISHAALSWEVLAGWLQSNELCADSR
jgi:hypothetical protein